MSKTLKLNKCKKGTPHKIVNVNASGETCKFLSNIGCKEGESVTIISKLATSLVVSIKGSRFGIDERMAKLIEVEKQ